MTLGMHLRTHQAQIFKLGHLIGVLQMSASELDEHIASTVQENPFMRVRPRRPFSLGVGGTTDVLETMAADEAASLTAHVMGQLAGPVARGGDLARVIIALVEELEPTGWLGRPLSQIACDLGQSEKVLEAALAFVQRHIEPAGLFARDLEECLRLQLVERGLCSAPMERVLKALNILAQGGMDGLVAATGLGRAEAQHCVATIRRLDPKPGARFQTDPTLMREPDVTVTKGADGWSIKIKSGLDSDVIVHSPQGSETSQEMRAALARANSLKQALDLRRSALEQIMRVMVARQDGFLREGAAALKPLSMSEIAAATGFHLSTVSRVLNGLLIECPIGIIAARDLCPRSCGLDGQTGPAKPKVVSRIRALLRAEDPAAPLSDPRLTELLKQEGLQVSRRVVSKYRQEIGLSSAASRRIQA